MILKMMTNYAGDYGKNLRQRRWAFLAILQCMQNFVLHLFLFHFSKNS